MRNDDDDDEDDDDSDDSEGEFADEGDWYASLIAGERVGEWLDVIEEETKQRSNEEEEEEGRRNRRRTKNDDANGRFRSAIEQLTKHVEEDEVYGEEAEVAEAERILSEALAKVSLTTNIDDDEEEIEIEKETSSSSNVQKLLRQSLAAIETHRKRKKNVKTYAMKNGRVEVSILETKLSNGVGGKLWKAALLLAEQLDDKEGEPKDDDDDDDGVIIDVKDKTVLELGAGVGLVGFAAAKLGAKEVVLSDFEAPLLEALTESVEMNRSEKTTKVRWLDWRADGASNTEKTEPPDAFLALEKEDTYDIILGSDCLY
jgi:ribosomal protein L11 methylase PrmA